MISIPSQPETESFLRELNYPSGGNWERSLHPNNSSDTKL
ncbi:hypothetical protein A2U01_0084261, partial [Trifolium medium]|nr:hypothetical protein [Trifolium medium]